MSAKEYPYILDIEFMPTPPAGGQHTFAQRRIQADHNDAAKRQVEVLAEELAASRGCTVVIKIRGPVSGSAIATIERPK